MNKLQNIILIALEFDVLPTNSMSYDDIKNLILKNLDHYGFSEKEFMSLTRDAKRFVYENTCLFKNTPLELKMQRIYDHDGDCYCIAFTKANRGCANCLYKKKCKKAAIASGIVDEKADKSATKKITKKSMDILESDVSFVAASKIWRSIRHYKGDDVFPKDNWVLLRDASGRERPIPKLAVELLEKLLEKEQNYEVTKKSTFMQIINKLKKYKLFTI